MRNGLTEVQVFVSCTSEVEHEVQLIKDACEELNRNYEKADCPIRFHVKYWRDKTGLMGTPAQAQINDWIKGYDFYIGILRSRFGTPTEEVNPETGEKYNSGTEQEYYEAYERLTKDRDSISVSFYFLEPINIPKTSEEAEQMRLVLRFKEGIRKHGWPNDFTTEKFQTSVQGELNTHGLELWKKVQVEQKKDAISFISDTHTNSATPGQNFLAGIEDTFTQLSYYIPRYTQPIVHEEKGAKIMRLIDDNDTPKHTLLNTIPTQKRIILLADAGVGKSIELQQAALHFKDEGTPFIPVFKRLNTYTGGSIEDFLPKGWGGIDDILLVVFLDGLDEVERPYFQIALSNVQNFVESHPDIRVVVSARTNFYEMPAKHAPGTLLGFKPYKLNDISIYQITQYLKEVHAVDGEAFVHEAYSNGYLDLISKPFFLEILIRHFLETGSLNVSRANVFREYLTTKISLDKEHFKELTQQTAKRNELVKEMERLALVMESLGRNYLGDDEVREAVSAKNYDDLKYITGLVKKQEGDKIEWAFEHNNLQEYLAAKALSSKPFETVKKFISFAPSHTTVNPSWVNTLSFWTSIADEKEKNALVNWLLQIDREIIVKFERDRIPHDLRFQIFQKIYAFYKKEDIWLRSNKFDAKQLAQFAQSEETLDFLLSEIGNASGQKRHLLNAISLVERMDFEQLSTAKYDEVIDLVIGVLETETDTYVIYELLSALGHLKLEDEVKIEQVFQRYQNRTNQYIRSGMYRVLIESDFIDNYIDYFLEGFAVQAKREDDDRERISLGDEGMLLRNALTKVSSSESIIRVFEFFTNDKNNDYGRSFDWEELLNGLVEKASKFYKVDKDVFNAVLAFYKYLGRIYDNKTAKLVLPFFEETKTKQEGFFAIFQSTDFGAYEKEELLALLIDESILDAYLKQYTERNFTNNDLTYLHNLLLFHVRQNEAVPHLLHRLESVTKELGGPLLQRPTAVDYESLRLEREQKSFDLLFDADALKQAVISVFNSFGEEEISSEEMYQLNRKKFSEKEFHPESVTRILWDWTRNRTVTLNQITQWMDNGEKFEDYRVNEIYEKIKGIQEAISDEQRTYLKNWVDKTLPLLDIPNAIRVTSKTSTSWNLKTATCWYFIKRFRFSIPKIKALDFTLFWDNEREQQERHYSIINTLENFVDISSLKKRVTANLQVDLPVDEIWKNNAVYALSKHLRSAYSAILCELGNEQRSVYTRDEVAKQFLEATKDDGSLFKVIKKGGLTNFHWNIMRLIIPKVSLAAEVITHLNGIMNDVVNNLEDRILASKYLMRLHDLKGLEFYAEHLLKTGAPDDDYIHNGAGFESITDIQALPILIKLLALSKQSAFKQDEFNSLENRLLDTISNIAIQSEENLMVVTSKLKEFIEGNKEQIEHLGFLHFSIERMEERFYQTKSQSLTLLEAIYNINQLVLVE
ncbi:MAG: hypothetical protein ABI378_13765 [Chitinophagaceae bacterium]